MGDVNTFVLPIWAWLLLAVLLFSQAAWIFIDASKRGEKRFLWGLFGLLNVPSSLFVYLIVTRVIMATKTCGDCGANIPKKARFCPGCGKEQCKE